ncbi:hypothetical protein F4821DRAFT_250073 [Hypoxylon rubiginosum]|uniref:Uncharacterized protein n=1 Tax=Hypoxylon rubiginosum TaxID=110542 RepID=A0ACC0CKW0_9PEZI|nr:hypothetical protein F4821DRAFT_250073 [Hypoxylon rubiginosum]
MDLINIVSSFLTNQAGQLAMALRDPKQEDLDKAAALYMAHGGRLPSPPPTSRLVPSER